MRLEEDLRGLVEDVPRFIRVDAASAWATARRRRVRRTAAAVTALVAVLAMSAYGLRALTRPVAIDPAGAPSGGGAALQLPGRLDHPIGPIRDLPRRAGPIAGVVHRIDGGADDAGWFAVSPRGGLWRLPAADLWDAYPPAVSPDGSTIVYLQATPSGHARVLWWNTVSGTIRFLSDVGDGRIVDGRQVDPMTRFYVAGQSPAYFSPEGTAVVVAGGTFPPREADRALLLRDTGATALPAPSGTRAPMPAGWLDDDHLVWVDGPRALVADVSGRVLRTVDLDVSRAEAHRWGQRVGPVSAGSELLAAGDAVFRLGGGRPGGRVEPPRIQGTRADACPATEAAVHPVVVTQGGGGVLLERSPGDRVVVADPHLGIDCSVWAADALHASRHASVSSWVWGDSTGWLSWWWREVGAGLGVAVVAAVLLARAGRRRRLRSSP